MTREKLIDKLLYLKLAEIQSSERAKMNFINDVLADGFISYFDRDDDQLQDLYNDLTGADHE